MSTLEEILEHLRQLAPEHLAEEWDNTGLLVGHGAQTVESIMTCLTLTPDVAEEAIRENVSLVVSHHPLMFRPVQQLTDGSIEGAMLLQLIRHEIAVYSPHTAWDSAQNGINQQWAEALELEEIRPLRILEDTGGSNQTAQGSGRWGRLTKPLRLGDLVSQVARILGVSHLQFVGDRELNVEAVGVACGAAAEFLADARECGCQVLLTGEARFHDCLEARNRNMGLILPGHYLSERPAMEALAKSLGRSFPKLRVWASRVESDPVQQL